MRFSSLCFWQKMILACLLVFILVNIFLARRIQSLHLDSWYTITIYNNAMEEAPYLTMASSTTNNNDSKHYHQNLGKREHLLSRQGESIPSKDSSQQSWPKQVHKTSSHETKDVSDAPANTDSSCRSYINRGYKGILHIAMGDIGGGASTIFFQFVIGQLIYAEQYRLLPLIHFNNVSNIIFDPLVHGGGIGGG